LAGPGDVGGNEEWGPPLEPMKHAGGSEDVIGPSPVDAGISVVPDGVDRLSDICEKARGVKLEARVGPSTSVGPSPRRHADKHRSERTILLAVDQELGEGPALRVAPELADPVGLLEVGEHEDVKQLGAGSGAEGFQPIAQDALDVLQVHGWD
jgi:hypothetical protein